MKNVVLLNNPVLEYRPDSSVPINITAVAKRIADILGGEMRTAAQADHETYYVPFDAVHKLLAKQKGITGAGDVYGGIVQEIEHADKAMLHKLPTHSAIYPAWYSPHFAQAVGGVVLPGFTTFTCEDTIRAFEYMQREGIPVRFKDPSNTGGLGQRVVRNSKELRQALVGHSSKLAEVGAVLEANLHNLETVTVGYVDISGEVYTWHGRPYNVSHNGVTRFGGNALTVVRGDFKSLQQHCSIPSDRLAVCQAEQVFNAYSILGATVVRATFDAVQGTFDNGTFLSGITDPSLRPSASSAAEIRAIEAFAANPHAKVVKTRLKYDYAKELPIESSSSRELFIAHTRMNIFVELVDIT